MPKEYNRSHQPSQKKGRMQNWVDSQTQKTNPPNPKNPKGESGKKRRTNPLFKVRPKALKSGQVLKAISDNLR